MYSAQVLYINCGIEDVKYTVEVYDSSGEVVLWVFASSSNCSNGICSALFPISEQYCGVSIKANNTFGESISDVSAISTYV